MEDEDEEVEEERRIQEDKSKRPKKKRKRSGVILDEASLSGSDEEDSVRSSHLNSHWVPALISPP